MSQPPVRFVGLTPSDQSIAIPETGVARRVVHTSLDGMRVIVFAFATGGHLAAHAAPHRAIVEVLSGEMELTLDDHPLRATAGAWVYTDPGVMHALRATQPAVVRLTLLAD